MFLLKVFLNLGSIGFSISAFYFDSIDYSSLASLLLVMTFVVWVVELLKKKRQLEEENTKLLREIEELKKK